MTISAETLAKQREAGIRTVDDGPGAAALGRPSHGRHAGAAIYAGGGRAKDHGRRPRPEGRLVDETGAEPPVESDRLDLPLQPFPSGTPPLLARQLRTRSGGPAGRLTAGPLRQEPVSPPDVVDLPSERSPRQ